jgi:hypothetical protein
LRTQGISERQAAKERKVPRTTLRVSAQSGTAGCRSCTLKD